MDLGNWLSAEKLSSQFDVLVEFVETEVLVSDVAVQLAVVAIAWLGARLFAARFDDWLKVRRPAGTQKFVYAVTGVSLTTFWLLLVWSAAIGSRVLEQSSEVLDIVIALLAAWVVIKLASRMLRHPLLAKGVALIAWSIAALSILGLLEPTIEILDAKALTIGDVRISAYTIAKSTLALAVLLWIAVEVSGIFERRIKTSDNLSPSVKVLLSKSLTVVLISLAVVVALESVGIDLTALAVFGGALGLGVGFGLQKIVGNLISGIILLLDKSIKPGDVVAVDQTYGWVNALGARYVSVITRDGTEHLIPNETLITERVENWTHSDKKRRVRLPVGVHYDSDVELSMDLCTEAATNIERVIQDPAPVCLLTEFGDNSVNLEVRFWIKDAQNGLANVKSQVMLGIWRAFKENDIEIPYPQRDLHLRNAEPLLEMAKEAGEAQAA